MTTGRQRGSCPQVSRADAVGAVDVPMVMKGASTGLLVIVAGGFIASAISAVYPATAEFALVVVAIIGFAVAGTRIGDARSPWLHGAFASALDYALCVPLVLGLGQGEDMSIVLLTGVLSLGLGALAGSIAGRVRDH